jgi:hypothetical protein
MPHDPRVRLSAYNPLRTPSNPMQTPFEPPYKPLRTPYFAPRHTAHGRKRPALGAGARPQIEKSRGGGAA